MILLLLLLLLIIKMLQIRRSIDVHVPIRFSPYIAVHFAAAAAAAAVSAGRRRYRVP